MPGPVHTQERLPAVSARRGFAPEAFGKYYLLDRVATGGMAEVFRAKTFGHSGFEKLVVIKRILSHYAEDPDFVAMFIDEARLSAQLTHPNVVQIYDFGKIGQNFFISMESVEGRDLKSVMRRLAETGEHMPVDIAVYVAHETAKALDYAHRKTDAAGRPLGLVHRDVSPSNVLLSFEGGVKLVDFGIAKASTHQAGSESGVLKGKFQYMSPEQSMAQDVDRRTDIFSTGICLWEMLTGQRLFKGASDTETLALVKNCNVLPPSAYNPEVPAELDQIVLKALSPDPSQRHAHGAALQRELQDFLMPSTPDRVAPRCAEFLLQRFAEEIRQDRDRLERATRVASDLHYSGEMDLEVEEDQIHTDSAHAAISPLEQGPTTSTVRPANPRPRGPSRLAIALGIVVLLLAGLLVGLLGPLLTEGTKGHARLTVTVLPGYAQDLRFTLDGAPFAGGSGDVEPGVPHTLRVEAAGFHPKERNFTVDAGRMLETEIVLDPVSPDLAEDLSTRGPSSTAAGGAAAALLGQPTPAEVPVGEGPTPGGTPTATEGVGGDRAAPSTILFESRPPGARVFVDGRRLGTTPWTWEAAEAGKTYQIEYRLEGYQSVQAVLDAPAGGGAETLTRELPAKADVAAVPKDNSQGGTATQGPTPAPPTTPDDVGRLSVQATPGWVKVYIDGAYVSTTPLFEHELPPGTHTIRLVHERQGIDRSDTVVIVAGQVSRKAYQLDQP